MAKAMEDLSDFVFVSMADVTLVRRDSYLAHFKSGLKQDTLAASRQAPLNLPTLFPDSVLGKAKEDIGKFEDKGHFHVQFGGRRDNHFYHYKRSDNQTQEQKSGKLGCFSKKKGGHQSNKFLSLSDRVSCHINDTYCESAPVPLWPIQSKETVKYVNLC